MFNFSQDSEGTNLALLPTADDAKTVEQQQNISGNCNNVNFLIY